MDAKLVAEAVLTTLKAAMTTLAYVEAIGHDVGSLDEFIQYVKLPSAGVSYGGGVFTTDDEEAEITDEEMTIQVWIVIDDYHGYAAGMSESGGIYDILNQIAAQLQGQKLGLDIAPLKRITQSPLQRTPGRIMWSQIWRTNFVN